MYNQQHQKQQKAGVIIIDHTPSLSLYLIVYSKKSKKFGFPKGTCEKNESIYQCAKREFYEETGMELRSKVRYNNQYKVFNNTYFIFDCYDDINNILLQKSNDIPDSNEISHYQWVDEKELVTLKNQSNIGLKTYIDTIITKTTKKPKFLKLKR